MQVVFVVLQKTECLESLLADLKKSGINGATILNSTGMIQYLNQSKESYLLGSLKLFLDDDPDHDSKTIFFTCEEDKLDFIETVVDHSIGGLDNPNTGILLAMPLTRVRGIRKK